MGGRKKRQGIRSGRRRWDSPTWAKFYREFYPQVRSWLIGRVANEQDADDLADEVLAKLARKGRSYNTKAYIATALANALSEYRHRKARERDFLQRLLEDARGANEIRRGRPQELSDDSESSETCDRVEEVLNMLPPAQAQWLRLRFLGGLSVTEVARRMGCSREAAYKRLQRALRRLREHCGVEPNPTKRPRE